MQPVMSGERALAYGTRPPGKSFRPIGKVRWRYDLSPVRYRDLESLGAATDVIVKQSRRDTQQGADKGRIA